MGAFGDSLSTAPSYADPLAVLLGVGYGEQAVGGYSTTDLIALLNPARVDPYSQRILLCGINDVNAGAAAATIEANLTALIATLDNPVVICLLPFGNYSGWDAGKEAVRVEVNTWIKANVEHYVDAELVLGDGDGSQPVLLAEYDSGDGLHLNDDGNAALAAVAESVVRERYGF